jgi:hypothetical protein
MRKSILAVAASAGVFAMVVAGASGALNPASTVVSSVTVTTDNRAPVEGIVGVTTDTVTFAACTATITSLALNQTENTVTGANVEFSAACADFEVQVTLTDSADPALEYESTVEPFVQGGTVVAFEGANIADLEVVTIVSAKVDVTPTSD